MIGNDWTPDPQLLAAYFDGELHRRADRAGQRRRIEAWLEAHPLEAIQERENHARIADALKDTAPPEPDPAAWRRLQKQLEDSQQGLPRQRRGRNSFRRQWLLLTGAAASLLLIVWLAWPARETAPLAKQQEEVEVFEVAVASEVVILRVDGEDTVMLAVGELPLQGELVLADRSDVANISFMGSDIAPTLRVEGESRPMIWAPTYGD